MDFNKIRILVVDDEIMILDMFKDFFERLGFNRNNVCVVSSFNDSEKALCARLFDIIISDYNYKTPPFDGLELLKRLRSGQYYHNENQSIPFLMLSGNSYADVEEALEAMPPTDFVSKPVGLGILCSKIKKMLLESMEYS